MKNKFANQMVKWFTSLLIVFLSISRRLVPFEKTISTYKKLKTYNTSKMNRCLWMIVIHFICRSLAKEIIRQIGKSKEWRIRSQLIANPSTKESKEIVRQ